MFIRVWVTKGRPKIHYKSKYYETGAYDEDKEGDSVAEVVICMWSYFLYSVVSENLRKFKATLESDCLTLSWPLLYLFDLIMAAPYDTPTPLNFLPHT